MTTPPRVRQPLQVAGVSTSLGKPSSEAYHRAWSGHGESKQELIGRPGASSGPDENTPPAMVERGYAGNRVKEW